jgi:hypothetical protein
MDEDWDVEMVEYKQQQNNLSSRVVPNNEPLHFSSTRNEYSNYNSSFSNMKNYSRGRNNEDRRYPSQNRDYKRRAHSPISIVEIVKINPRSIGALIGKSGSTINELRERYNVQIYVPKKGEFDESEYSPGVEIKISGLSKENVEKAKEEIKKINGQSASPADTLRAFSFSGEQARRNYSNDKEEGHYSKASRYNNNNNNNGFSDYRNIDNDYNNNDKNRNKQDDKANSSASASSEFGAIDWDLIRSQPLQNMNKFKDHPQIIKDFYVEDSEITQMTREQVKQYRKDKFNIEVKLFEKIDLTYSGKNMIDTRTPEEIEDYLFKSIPKPVKTIEQAFRKYPEIIAECRKQNFIEPTPIQAQLWPILLKGQEVFCCLSLTFYILSKKK